MLFGEGDGTLEVLVLVATLTGMVLVRVEGEVCWSLMVVEGTLLCVSRRSLGDSQFSRLCTGVRWSEGELNTTCVICANMEHLGNPM